MLNHVGRAENLLIPEYISDKIVQHANGNVRKALLILEAMRMQQYRN